MNKQIHFLFTLLIVVAVTTAFLPKGTTARELPQHDAVFEHSGDSLMEAIRNEDLALAKSLIAGGADVNYEAQDETTPLLMAAQIKKSDLRRKMTTLLLDKGADVNHSYSGIDNGTLLYLLIMEFEDLGFVYLKDAELLLEHGADPNHKADGYSALRLLMETYLNADDQSGFLEFAKLLIKNGADGNELIAPDLAPLFLAYIAEFEDLELMELFLQHGVDPNLRFNSSEATLTPLSYISLLKNHNKNLLVDYTEALIDAGANVNATIELSNDSFSLLEFVRMQDAGEAIEETLKAHGAE